ncbi:MAG: LytTR family transcriptional regulator DNA-binding domain-containing protein [Bacteroidia bacterium]
MNFLKKPYPLETNLKKLLSQAFLFGLFVFVFLYGFKPFGLNELKNGLFEASLGFGGVTIIFQGFLPIFLRKIFPSFFNEEKWTLGRNLALTMVIVIAVVFGNFYWAYLNGFTSFSATGLFTFLGYTFAVGVFPLSFLMLFEQNRLTKKYLSESASINEQLAADEQPEKHEEKLVLKCEDGSEAITISEDAFYYCKSADNYIELIYETEGEVKKELFRNSLKNLELLLAEFNDLKRVHRSYIVNLNKVKSVDGNARGLKLKLNNDLPEIPISRTKHDEILALLDSH